MSEFIGRYQLLSEIGAGGMGTVYRALDGEIQREVALKLLPNHFTRNSSFIERFKREARVIGRLEHPHIVPVYDVGEHEGRPFLVMRLLAGGTLHQRMKQPQYHMEDFLITLQEVADALDVAHGQGIVHRDIKPSNILFDDRGSAFLADFGIAKLMDAATQLTGSGVIGTPSYMAPEQFTKPTVDGRCDQYALAVVVFEALAGRLPFEGDTTAQVMFKHLSEPPPDIHILSENTTAALNHVLKRALAKDATVRYPAVGDFILALRAAISAAPTLIETSLTVIEETMTTVTVPPAVETVPPPVSPPPDQRIAPPDHPPPSDEADSLALIDRHYQRGLEAMNRSAWPEAVAAFDDVSALDPGYLNTRNLRQQALDRVEPAVVPVTPTAVAGGSNRPKIVRAAAVFLGVAVVFILAFILLPLLGQEPDPTLDAPAVLAVTEATNTIEVEFVEILVTGSGIVVQPPGEESFTTVSSDGQLLMIAGTQLRSGDEPAVLELPNGAMLFLAPASELTLIPSAESPRSDIRFLLADGALLVASDAGNSGSVVIQGPSAATVTVKGLGGVSSDAQTAAFAVDCFTGTCLLDNGAGDLLSLRRDEYSHVASDGALAPIAPARPALYCALASERVACPTPTPEPTSTPTATATQPTAEPASSTPPPVTPTLSPTQPPPTPTQPPPTQPPPTQPPPTQPPPTQPPPTQPPPTQPPPTQPPPTDPPAATYTPEPP